MTRSLRRVSNPNSFVSLFVMYILSYLLLKRVGCLSGCLVSSASIQKLFCGSCSEFKWTFDKFVGEKVVSLSYPLTSYDLPPCEGFSVPSVQFSSFQSLSSVWLFANPCTASCQASLSITNSWNVLNLMSIESVMPSNYLSLYRPLLLLSSIFPSIRVFSNESALCIRWPKIWSFSFNISTSDEYSGLISLRMDRLDHLSVQGTLKSLLQHHTSKASIPQCSAFFMVQLSHPYMTSGKTISLMKLTLLTK